MAFLKKNKSLRPKKEFERDSSRYSLHKYVKTTLGSSANFEKAVILPEGEDKNEWFSVHVVDFYNNLSLILGAIENQVGLCKETMSAGEWEYLWKDESTSKYKKAQPLPPLEFINCTFDFIEKKINNKKLFPLEGGKYPKDKEFRKIVKDLFKKMFRVFAHIFVEQFVHLEKVGMTAHLNTAFKHFILFTFQFKLIKKQELAPMNDWIIRNLGKKYESNLKLKKKK